MHRQFRPTGVSWLFRVILVASQFGTWGGSLTERPSSPSFSTPVCAAFDSCSSTSWLSAAILLLRFLLFPAVQPHVRFGVCPLLPVPSLSPRIFVVPLPYNSAILWPPAYTNSISWPVRELFFLLFECVSTVLTRRSRPLLLRGALCPP